MTMLALLLLVAAGQPVLPAQPAQPVLPAQPAQPVLPVLPRTPVTIAFDAAATADLPRGAASVTAHGETIRCEGVWLSDLIVRAGLPAGPAVRGPALAAAVIAAAADGYRVLFGAAEIEPGIGTTRVLVADRCTGAVAAGGDVPRLVVPGDARAARSVRNLRSLTYVPDPTGTAALR